MLNKYKIIILTIVLLLSAIVSSVAKEYQSLTPEQLLEIIPSSKRYVVSLSGNWETSYNGVDWHQTYIPNSNNTNSEVIYKRIFKLDKAMIGRFVWHIYFLGVEDQVEIYLNDLFIGRYYGGMTPFYVRLPETMILGESNTIKLIVSGAEHAAKQIKEQNVFSKKVVNGIIREPLLIGTPPVWTSAIEKKIDFSEGFANAKIYGKVSVSAGNIDKPMPDSISSSNIDLDKIKVSVRTSVLIAETGDTVSRGVSKVVELSKERTIDVTYSHDIQSAKLWSPETPYLYKLYIQISKDGKVIDDIAYDIGLRDIRVETVKGKPGIFLNGKRCEFKGVEYIEDYYGSGQTLTTDRLEKDVMMMKVLGANIIRYKYGIPHPYLVNLCNKYGIMMLVELPVYNVPASIIALDEIKVRMQNNAERLLSTFNSHPSIIAWGIASGVFENTPEFLTFSKQLSEVFKKSSDKLLYKETLLGSQELNTDYFDFLLIKFKQQIRDFKVLRDEINRMKGLAGSKPIVCTFGKAIQPDNHNGFSDPVSLESQAHFIQNCFQLAKQLHTTGSIIWSFNDYSLQNPLLILNLKDNFICTSGILMRNRQPRLSFNTLQSLFNEEKKPLLNAGSYTEKTPLFFIVLGIALCILLISMAKRFRRFREYFFRSLLRPYNFYADIRDQRIMSTVQTFLLGIVISISMGLFYSSICYYYRNSEIAQYIFMILLPWSGIQELFFKLIWMPELLAILSSIVFFMFTFVIAFALKISSLFVKANIFYSDTLTITIWSGVPIIAFLPISIVLIKILVMEPSLIAVLSILCIAITIWVFYRLLRATAVVFDIMSVYAYIIGSVLLIGLVVIIIATYQVQFSLFSFGEYILQVLLTIR